MTWTTGEIEVIMVRRPKLAVALLQILAQRTVDLGHRIESFSRDDGPAVWRVLSCAFPGVWARPMVTARFRWPR